MVKQNIGGHICETRDDGLCQLWSYQTTNLISDNFFNYSVHKRDNQRTNYTSISSKKFVKKSLNSLLELANKQCWLRKEAEYGVRIQCLLKFLNKTIST